MIIEKQVDCQLEVGFVEVQDEFTGETISVSWGVEVDVPDEDIYGVFLWGFTRRIDAEIAKKFMLSLPIDWGASRLDVWEQIRAAGYPDRESLRRAACERLQW